MRLLDLYCGGGGSAVGYARAGFEVVGVDLYPQKHYPFEFHRADALSYLVAHGREFDAIHASPPCQAYSTSTSHARDHGKVYPELINPTRALLEWAGRPWVMENVPRAGLRPDVVLCGCYFGLQVHKRRVFETSFTVNTLLPGHDHSRPVFYVFGDSSTEAERKRLGRRATMQEWRDAMGIDWGITGHALGQSIPPAYTEFIGGLLAAHIAEGSP